MKNDVLGKNKADSEIDKFNLEEEVFIGVELKEGLNINGKGKNIGLVAKGKNYLHIKLKNINILHIALAPSIETINIDELILENVSVLIINNAITISNLSLNNVKTVKEMKFNSIEVLKVIGDTDVLNHNFDSLKIIELKNTNISNISFDITKERFPNLRKVYLVNVKNKPSLEVIGKKNRKISLYFDSNDIKRLKLYNVELLNLDKTPAKLSGTFEELFFFNVSFGSLTITGSSVDMMYNIKVKDSLKIVDSLLHCGIRFSKDSEVKTIEIITSKVKYPTKDEEFEPDLFNIDLSNLNNLESVIIYNSSIFGLIMEGYSRYVNLKAELFLSHKDYLIRLDKVNIQETLWLILESDDKGEGGVFLKDIIGAKELIFESDWSSPLNLISLDMSKLKGSLISFKLVNVNLFPNELFFDKSFSELSSIHLENVKGLFSLEITKRGVELFMQSTPDLSKLIMDGVVCTTSMTFNDFYFDMFKIINSSLEDLSLEKVSSPSIVIQNVEVKSEKFVLIGNKKSMPHAIIKTIYVKNELKIENTFLDDFSILPGKGEKIVLRNIPSQGKMVLEGDGPDKKSILIAEQAIFNHVKLKNIFLKESTINIKGKQDSKLILTNVNIDEKTIIDAEKVVVEFTKLICDGKIHLKQSHVKKYENIMGKGNIELANSYLFNEKINGKNLLVRKDSLKRVLKSIKAILS